MQNKKREESPGRYTVLLWRVQASPSEGLCAFWKGSVLAVATYITESFLVSFWGGLQEILATIMKIPPFIWTEEHEWYERSIKNSVWFIWMNTLGFCKSKDARFVLRQLLPVWQWQWDQQSSTAVCHRWRSNRSLGSHNPLGPSPLPGLWWRRRQSDLRGKASLFCAGSKQTHRQEEYGRL